MTDFKVDFIGIGAAKAGTTWLGHVLAEHPQICMSEPKEVHFFNDRIAFRNPIMKPNYARGLQWYRKYFSHAHPGQIIGEITPRYSVDPVAAERIFHHNPKVKLLYCLRSPADRIESQYNFYKYFVSIEDRPIAQAISEEPEYLEMCRYDQHLQHYLRYFKWEQIHLVWFQDILNDPQKVISEVYSFLGVDPEFTPNALGKKANPARESRSSGFQFFTRKVIYFLVSIGLSGLVHRLKRTNLKDRIMKLNSKPLVKERLTPEIRQYILAQLHDDIIGLEKRTGKDLSSWKNVPA